MAWLSLAGEGIHDLAVATRLCLLTNHEISAFYVAGGKDRLDERLPGYNAAAARSAWFVLRDLDHDAGCAPELRNRLLHWVSAYMCLRIPVRSLEAWLMADRKGLARYLSAPLPKIPRDAEGVTDPKQTLVNIARRSRRRVIRDEMVPRGGATSAVGRGYTAHLIEFAERHWDPAVAARNCPSLAKCVGALMKL